MDERTKIKERLAGPDVTRAEFDSFHLQTARHIRRLRAESAKYRHQRNDARAELAALRAEIGR